MSRSRFTVAFAASLGLCATACPHPPESLGVTSVSILGSGVINDPRNKSLRFDVLKFGLERFCFEMTRRGAPLKLSDDQPVVGRFFANQCSTQVIDDDQRKSFVVQFAGKGWGWQQITGRMGFNSSGLIEYAPDFQMHEGAMYVYFRPRSIQATQFQLQVVESGLASTGMRIAGVDPNQLGRTIVDGQLQRGFTVIRRDSSGETEFGMGYVPLGQRPFHPYRIENSEKVTLANERTEVHTQQQDYVGAFEITDDDQALYIDASVDGTQAIDVYVVMKGAGDVMVDALTVKPGPALLGAQPVLEDVVSAGQPWRRVVRVPRGAYYLVFDNSSQVGRVAPPGQGGDDRAAKVDYLIQLGDAP